MLDLLQPQIIDAGLNPGGRRYGIAPQNKLQSQLPELKGKLFGCLMVVSGDIIRKKEHGRPYLLTECTKCATQSLKEYTSLTKKLAGCRRCSQPRRVPKWLYQRANSAKDRCVNPNSSSWIHYGKRGIEFRFSSPLDMALYVMENLGLHREMEIDRINNEGHYEPGNLRYSTAPQNLAHTRKRMISAQAHAFQAQHPEIKYAGVTLSRLIAIGLSSEEIIQRFNTRSSKPKGVYGTSLTPDAFIASLSKDF